MFIECPFSEESPLSYFGTLQGPMEMLLVPDGQRDEKSSGSGIQKGSSSLVGEAVAENGCLDSSSIPLPNDNPDNIEELSIESIRRDLYFCRGDAADYGGCNISPSSKPQTWVIKPIISILVTLKKTLVACNISYSTLDEPWHL